MKETVDMPVVDHCEGVCKNSKNCRKYFVDSDNSLPYNLGYKYTCEANPSEDAESFKKLWNTIYKDKEEEKEQ